MTPFPVDPEKDTICGVIQGRAETRPEAPALPSEDHAPLAHSIPAAHGDGIGALLDASRLGRGWPIGRKNGCDKYLEA